ncbi:MAG: hypothetical protein IJT41_02610 [Clostridia bacterium]|nr:hypothetical protein [Clostridia bacterium]
MTDYHNQLDPELQGDSANETIPESQEETGDTTPTEPEDPAEKYKDHFALAGKGCGACGQMLKNVCVIGFLVNDRSSAWKEDDLEKIKIVLQNATSIMKKQSGLSDNRLKISYAYDCVPIQFRFDRDENSARVITDVLGQYGYLSVSSYQDHYKKKFNKQEVPIVFFVNRDFRSFAHKTEARDDNSGGEYSFVSYNQNIDDCVRTLIHEVMHQFGAIDYYIPDRVKDAAEKLLPGSIMNSGMVFDDLTRYIIGWDEELSKAAVQFLEETNDITEEEIRKAREKDKDNDW